MKPINEMSLAECLGEVKLLNGVYGYNDPPLLANRIHELTRWIPVGERLPDENDGKHIHVIDTWGLPFTIMRSQWHQHTITHWRRIDTPEGV